MTNFETIIGIEIHIELNTKTKMFSPAKNSFDDKPNTNVHPIDLGYPGTLPRLNKGAVIRAIKLAKALQMEIDSVVKFDRKNYFYPDLPKGFQITQQFHPIGQNGILNVEVEDKIFLVEIERIHMEEDTAKQIHTKKGTLLDFNRAGIPLVEIVTKPIIKSSAQAIAYVETIKKIVLALGIGDAKMSEGSLRVDVNLSLKPFGDSKFGTKVEIKNMNSLANMNKAIKFEIARQKKLLMKHKVVKMETRRFDEMTQTTIKMRDKTTDIDYRYFRESNIPIIKLSDDFINNIKLDELPWKTKKRLNSYKLNKEIVALLLKDFELLSYFNSFNYNNKIKLVNIIIGELVPLSKKFNLKIHDLKINKRELEIALIEMDKGNISGKQLKEIILILNKENLTTKEIISKYNFNQISDENKLTELLEQIILENKIFLDELNARPEKVYKIFLGLLMKKTKGKANPIKSNQILEKILKGK